MMDTPAFLNAVIDQTDTLAQWVDDEDPTLPVPTCPEWNLGDLVDHVGATQLMVTVLVGERLTDPSRAFEAYSPAPTDPAQWREWLTDRAAEATQAFADVDDSTPVWDPSGTDAGVPFWSRRLFGESAVHLADAASALGTQYDLAPERAAAAVDDWLDTVTSRGYWDNVADFAEAMSGTGQTLRFRATDADGDWLARRQPDRILLERGANPAQERGSSAPEFSPTTGESTGVAADVTVAGSALDLLLVISRRRPLDSAQSLVIDGDRALLEHWIDHMDWVAG